MRFAKDKKKFHLLSKRYSLKWWKSGNGLHFSNFNFFLHICIYVYLLLWNIKSNSRLKIVWMIFTAKKFSLSISIEHETRQIPLRRWLGLFKHNLRSRNSLKHICVCFQVKRKDISSESKRQKIQFHGYVKPIWIDHGPRGNWVRGEGPVKKFGGKEFCLERMPGIGIITKCFPNVSYWEGSHFSKCIFTDIVFKI